MREFHPIKRKLLRSYKKNLPDLMAVIRRRHPDFVFNNRLQILQGEVPVFNFHSVSPERFESQLRHLQRNGYRTLSANELVAVLNRETPVPDRAVLLTFDDGTLTLWSVAFPLLKRYGFKAVAFVIPDWVADRPTESFSLESAGRGEIPMEEILQEGGPDRFCSWKELGLMQQSGLIDIQSHSLHHARVFVSPKIVDFFSPQSGGSLLKYDFPVFRESGRDQWDRSGLLGMPIYENRPRLSGHARYLDDEALRLKSVRHVADHGGADYFSRSGAYRELFSLAGNHRKAEGDRGRFEMAEEREEALFEELEGSKRQIEENLPGHRVRHFCYPWWSGSDRAVDLSKKAGYDTNFWGILPGRRTNRPGDDPYHIVRLLDDYLFRLPGDGRRSLVSILAERFRTHGPRFMEQSRMEGE